MRARHTLALGGFRGVDLSSSPLEVAGSRASLAYNLISENGVNHKRHGFEEMVAFEGRINGVFPFRENGKEILLVHAGTALWRYVKGESPTKISGTLVLADQRSQCFCRDGVAFLVGCGEYLAYGKHDGEAYTLVPVSKIAYVPTTTSSVGWESALGFDRNESNTERYTMESVNTLTPWRKNTLTVPNEQNIGNGNMSIWFKLDGLIDEDTKITLVICDTEKEYPVDCSKEGEEIVIDGDYYPLTYDIEIRNNADLGCAIVNIKFNVYLYELVKGQTITARFSSAVLAYQGRISRCRFGTTFGVSGAADRLFLSGDPEMINKDFFSEAEDFTYFPDGNVLTVGNDSTPVTGYARLSDATLAVFKGESMDDASIYFRTGEERMITDADGHEVPAAFFPTVAGTVGEHLIGAHTVANLFGDVLFLSKNGVFGVELSANVSSTERYARERSRAIFEDLKRRGVTSDAASIVFRGRYYLALGDDEGTCYVADSRYKATFEGTTDVGYEWWVWKGIPARTFAICEDEMIFGTLDGKLCRFGEGFADITVTELPSGSVTQSSADPTAIVMQNDLTARDGDRVVLNGAIYGLLLDACTQKDGRISLPPYDEESLRALVKRILIMEKWYLSVR